MWDSGPKRRGSQPNWTELSQSKPKKKKKWNKGSEEKETIAARSLWKIAIAHIRNNVRQHKHHETECFLFAPFDGVKL